MHESNRPGHVTIEVARRAGETNVTVLTNNESSDIFPDGQSALSQLKDRQKLTTEAGYAAGFASAFTLAYLEAAWFLQEPEAYRGPHAILAVANLYVANKFLNSLKEHRAKRNLANLQAKAVEDARAKGFNGEKSIFPMNPDSRVIAAIDSIQKTGKKATYEEIRREDGRLRNPENTKKPNKLSKRATRRALARLTEKQSIKPTKEIQKTGNKLHTLQPITIYEITQAEANSYTS